MSQLKGNSADGGTDGSSVSTTNSGGRSGDAFTAVTTDSPAAVIYDSTHKAAGTLGYKFSSNSTSARAFVEWGAIARSSISWRGYIYRAALPGTSLFFLLGLQTSGSTAFRVRITTAGLVELQNSSSTAVYTSVTAITTAAQNRIEVDVAVSGAWAVRVYTGANADGTTPSFSSSATGASFGTDINTLRMGNATANNSGDTWLDSIAYGTSALGAYVTPSNYVGGIKLRVGGAWVSHNIKYQVGGNWVQ